VEGTREEAVRTVQAVKGGNLVYLQVEVGKALSRGEGRFEETEVQKNRKKRREENRIGEERRLSSREYKGEVSTAIARQEARGGKGRKGVKKWLKAQRSTLPFRQRRKKKRKPIAHGR